MATPVPAHGTPHGSHGFTGAKTFSSLRHRDFALLWTSALFSSAGQWLQQISLGWLVWLLSGSPLLVGTVTGIRVLPFLIITPFGGVLADRFDRRLLLVASQAVMFFVALAFAVDVGTGTVQVWHCFAFSLITGSVWAFNQPLRSAMVVNTVPRADLMNALALQSMAWNLMRAIGPMIAGLLIANMGIESNFYIQAVTYLGVALIILPVRANLNVAAHDRAKGNVFGNMAEGMKYVATRPLLLGLFAMGVVPSIFFMGAIQQMPVFADRVFGKGADALGMLLSAQGVGTVLGAFIIASVAHRMNRKGTVIVATLVASNAALLLLGLSDWLWASLALLAIGGLFQMMFRVIHATLVQTLTPNHLLGRVTSIYSWEQGFQAVGAFVIGAMAEWWSAPLAVTVTGIVGLAASLFLARVAVSVRKVQA